MIDFLKLIQGMGVGFSIAAPVGAIGFLCIQQTLIGGILLGVVSGLGAATADMIYGILVALGMTASQAIILGYKTPLNVIGGLFLCYLGLKKFWAVTPHVGAIHTTHDNLFRAYVMTLLLTLTNPATILDFAALFVGLNVNVTGYTESLSFVGGVFIGSACWWMLLCFTVSIFRKRISQNMLRYINYIAGIVIFSFGLYALSTVMR